jgi:hypothetical protein
MNTWQTVTRAITRQLSRDELTAVASHGADAGWHGFTYHRDTDAFYRKHRSAINTRVLEMAKEFGMDPVD